MAKANKSQHFVPRSYLEQWCDPATPEKQTPYVWRFPRMRGKPWNKSPANTFAITDFYTITIPGVVQGRDLRIEHGLSGVENSFMDTMRRFIGQHKMVPLVPAMKLLLFAAAQQGRTPAMRDYMLGKWREVLASGEKIIADVDKHFGGQSPYTKKPFCIGLGPDMDLDDIRRNIANALHYTLEVNMSCGVPFLASLKPSILCREREPFFITSDDPFGWLGPDMERRFYLMHTPQHILPVGEITLPLSPRRMLLLGQHNLKLYVDVHADVADELNRRTRAQCGEEFVGCLAQDDPFWYDDSKPLVDVIPMINKNENNMSTARSVIEVGAEAGSMLQRG